MNNNIDLIMKQNISSWNEPTTDVIGKKIVCNICDIQKIELLSELSKISDIMDIICKYNGYDATQSLYNKRDEEDNGCTMIYLLTTGHISIHTFPEKKLIAFDLYNNSNHYNSQDDYILIYEFLVEVFEAGIFTSSYQIMEMNG
jgi:S-adenosylmethionine/arginine decarboxylase-like enzyme